MKSNFLKKISLFIVIVASVSISSIYAQDNTSPALKHPNTSGAGWKDLFDSKLSNAIYPEGVWSYTKGIITATKDEALWSEIEYDNFILDLEFKNADSTNSGIIVHASDMKDWIPHSVEIQIADDFSKEWSTAPPSWQCAAVFGHQAASKHTVKKPGKWNHFTITCQDRKIWIVLNGVLVMNLT